MKKFIAYFDLLGFKDFIYKNDLDSQKGVFNEIFVFIEKSLAENKFSKTPKGVMADISNSTINVTNFSDTIIFWTNDDTQNSLEEFVRVTYLFNWQMIRFTFPLRGAIVFGEIEHINFKQNNNGGGLYNINSVYGKGIVDAYIKAESQNWAGTVIDGSFIEKLTKSGINVGNLLTPFTKRYRTPYKKYCCIDYEYVFQIVEGIIDGENFDRIRLNIEQNFANHKKSVTHSEVKEKIKNTITFLETFKE